MVFLFMKLFKRAGGSAMVSPDVTPSKNLSMSDAVDGQEEPDLTAVCEQAQKESTQNNEVSTIGKKPA